MTKRTNPVWLLAILWLLLGCKEGIKSPNPSREATDSQEAIKSPLPKPSPPATDIYAKAATETCTCMQPMIEKAKYLKALEDSKQLTDMKRVAEEMEQLRPQIQKCSDEIRQKYSQINSHDEEKRIYKALLAQCPDLEILFSSLGKVADSK